MLEVTVSHLEEKMQTEIKWINMKVNHICKSLNIKYDEIESWLQQNRSKLYDDLDRLFEAINTDIQGRSLNNDVDEIEFKAWEKKVEEWRDRYTSLLDDFWEGNVGGG